MSVRGTLRAAPTLLRVGFAEAIAYRAEMFVWVLSTTMPFVMLALWTAVAREEPVLAPGGGRFGPQQFVAYFLATFVVRQLTSSWAAWEMNFEVRTGALSARLLRPLNPIVAYAAENLGALPMRIAIILPVVLVVLAITGGGTLPRDPVLWLAFVLAVIGAWIITFLANAAIGCLSLFMQSSVKVMDVWLALFFVFSGYLFPIQFLPTWVRGVVDWLPFRYMIGFPVELLNSMHGSGEAFGLLARECVIIAALALLVSLLWTRGLRRFQAYGG
ncbi:MAG: ABC transporter permease [Myxococcaceae bacterium]